MRMVELHRQRARCACGGEAGPDSECATYKQKQWDCQLQCCATTATTPHFAPPLPIRPSNRQGSHSTAARVCLWGHFGADFGGVLVHTNEQADAGVKALAYTVGRNMVFMTSIGRRTQLCVLLSWML
jgi:hypothetical protein